MLCFVDRGVLLGGGESVILWNKFLGCFVGRLLLVRQDFESGCAQF